MKKNKKMFVFLGIASLVMIGAGIYLIAKRKKTAIPLQSENTEPDNKEIVSAGSPENNVVEDIYFSDEAPVFDMPDINEILIGEPEVSDTRTIALELNPERDVEIAKSTRIIESAPAGTVVLTRTGEYVTR